MPTRTRRWTSHPPPQTTTTSWSKGLRHMLRFYR
jgi:hypothetical protein